MRRMNKFLMLSTTCFFGIVSLIGCDVKDKRGEESQSVVGAWDNGTCRDRIILNEDKTFAWQDVETYAGNYWIEGNQINFKFAGKLPEVYQFTVSDKALTLLKSNTQYEYVKVAPIVNSKGEVYIPPHPQKTKSDSTNSCAFN